MAIGYPQFDGFSLQDDNFIMSEISYRLIPKRQIESDKVLRRPGVKILSADFTQRVVTMKGSIVATSATDLRNKIDALHTNVTRKDSGLLYIESDRSGYATVDNVVISDPHYSQTFVPIEIQLMMPDPFFYAAQQVVSLPVTSGVLSQSYTITITGSMFAEPSIIYYSPDAVGTTPITKVSIEYGPTGELITWSGIISEYLSYDSSITFDYVEHLLLEGTETVHPTGVFQRWEPGSTEFTITFSGATVGGTLQFAYQPRYL